MHSQLPSPFENPTLRDDLPRYPHLLQLLRVTSTVIANPGGNTTSILYAAFVQQQATSTLVPRDREACIANDVNGLGLNPGYYLGRLAGSYTNLPVYEASGTPSAVPPAYLVNHYQEAAFVMAANNIHLFGSGITTVTVFPYTATHVGYSIYTPPQKDCADCVYVVNITNLTIVTTNVITTVNNIVTIINEGQTVYNQYDQNVWVWTADGWKRVCDCDSQSGDSGSGDCVPGKCSLCPNPPEWWTLTVAGFDGLCAAFNRTWTLFPSSSCTWVQTTTGGGVSITATIVLDAGGYNLSLVGAGATPFSAYFSAPPPANNDCCVDAVFTIADGGCDCGGVDVAPCGTCAGDTPISWTVTFSGFTGSLTPMNGTYTLSRIGECVWGWSGGPGGITFNLGGLTFKSIYGSATWLGEVSSDCCSPVELALTSNTPGGDADATITVTPVCEEVGSCPDTLTATPTCCDHEGPGGCDVTIPPNPLFATITGCSCVSSSLELNYDGSGAFGPAWYSDPVTCPGHTLFFYFHRPDPVLLPDYWQLVEVYDGIEYGSNISPAVCVDDAFDWVLTSWASDGAQCLLSATAEVTP